MGRKLYKFSTGEPIFSPERVKLITAVLDAGSGENRFSATKQLLDIGVKLLKNPGATVSAGEFTDAPKGAVAVLPTNPAMYQRQPLNILYSKNPTSRGRTASSTKVMSLVTGLEFWKDLEEIVEIKSYDVLSGSGNFFAAGDTMTMREMMLSMMLPSSNTCAKAFGRIVGEKMLKMRGVSGYSDADCTAEFVRRMNLKASFIGIENPNFDTAAGGTATLSPVDLIRVGIEACSYPDICKTWGKKTHTFTTGGSNPHEVVLETTVTDPAIEAEYTILGGKTGSLDYGRTAAALVMVAEVEV